MDNSVTLFLLFTYSAIMGAIAIAYLTSARGKNAAGTPHGEKKPKFKRRHNMLEKLTDPVFNAQYEIGRKLKKSLQENSETAITASPSGAQSVRENPRAEIPADAVAESGLQNSGGHTDENFAGEEDHHYEIDAGTLELLISTFAYDDFAKIYEKFLHARSEDEICRLVGELEDFRDDDRLLMILTPLLSHESPRVQNAVNGFVMRTNNPFITDEMVNILENSDFMRASKSADPQSEYIPGAARPDAGLYAGPAEEFDLGVDRSVFFEPPHKLVLEAYQTNDRDRLFAISCALAQYDDPVIVEAMLYINARLNGDLSRTATPAGGPNILKAEDAALAGPRQAARPAGILKAAGDAAEYAETGPQKFNFTSINEIFKNEAPETRVKFKQLSKSVSSYSTKSENKAAAASSRQEERSSSNDYVKGIKLVNISRFAPFDECAAELTDALGHEGAYVRCCAITAIKTLAGRAFAAGDSARLEEYKSALMSHELFEKNTEVASLCAKAITEIENYSTASFDIAGTGETQNEYAFHPGQADQAVSLANEARTGDAVNQ